MKIKHIIFFLLFNLSLVAQDNSLSFFLDAIVFKSDTIGKGRIDVFAVVPYQNLEFKFIDGKYIAKYRISLVIYDKNNINVVEKHLSKFVKENTYYDSQGGSGKFDFSAIQMQLLSGDYKIKLHITDEYGKKEGERTRQMNILNYELYPFALSGLMILSSIEELDGKYKITPHLSDNVGSLTDGYFGFFEVYNQNETKEIDFIYEITDSDNKQITSGDRKNRKVPNGKSQQYIKVPNITKAGASYNLKILALKPSKDSVYNESDIIAVAQRLMKSTLTVNGIVRKDLSSAIKQLRYVANSKDLNYIEEGKNDDEKQLRFDMFWKNLDPTPNTDRNEAFDEYFKRIAYVNKSYKSYSDGWLTDKGNVFIVFGQPNNIENSYNSNNGVRYERWVYQGNREYIFSDNSGFGDFRLIRPFAVTEKYIYNR